ncbi:MAG: hypothetical protein WC415_06125 [Patescibacteria group bacterium]|jgi:hypothetical protein
MSTSILPYGLNMIIVLISVGIAMIGLFCLYGAFARRKADRIMYMRQKAKDENIPIIVVVDNAGYGISALGIADEREDIYFKDKKLSLRVRPSFLDIAEPLTLDGIKTYIYPASWFFPIGVKGLTCLTDVVEIIRKDIPQLNFITDDLALIMGTCVYEGRTLEENCKSFISEYEQSKYLMKSGKPVQKTEMEERVLIDDETDEEILDEFMQPQIERVEVPIFDENDNPVYELNPDYVDASELLRLMQEAREIVMAHDIRSGPLKIKTAMSLIPGRADGHTLNRLLTIQETKNDIKNATQEKWAKFLMFAAAFACLGVVLCYLIYTLIGPGS